MTIRVGTQVQFANPATDIPLGWRNSNRPEAFWMNSVGIVTAVHVMRPTDGGADRRLFDVEIAPYAPHPFWASELTVVAAQGADRIHWLERVQAEGKDAAQISLDGIGANDVSELSA